MEEDLNLKDKIDKIYEKLEKAELPKVKKLKIPRKAKVRKGKAKKGWVGIIKIDENRVISGEKQQIIDSTVRLNDKTYHNFSAEDMYFWEGKFPVVFQATKKVDPYHPETGVNALNGKNETKGQKYLMSRMIGDTIKVKVAGGAKTIFWIIGIAIAGYIAYSMFTGGF